MKVLLLTNVFHLCFQLVSSSINVYTRTEHLLASLDDTPTDLGPPIPYTGIQGHHVFLASKDDPCFYKPHLPPTSMAYWFAVVTFNKSCYIQQISNLEDAGYRVVILYDSSLDDSTNPFFSDHLIDGNSTINIPSTFVGNNSFRILLKYNYNRNTTTVIYGAFNNLNELVLILLATLCLSIVIALLISLSIFACVKLYRNRASFITRWRLKWSPCHVFNKGDDYECCVICLDEYLEGERLRVLSCGHAFHTKCVDPWLIKKEQECPLCKRKADLKRHKSERGCYEEEDEDDDERTALLGGSIHDDEDDYHDGRGLINTVVVTNVNRSYGAIDSPVATTSGQHKTTNKRHNQNKSSRRKHPSQGASNDDEQGTTAPQTPQVFASVHTGHQPTHSFNDADNDPNIKFYIGSVMETQSSYGSENMEKLDVKVESRIKKINDDDDEMIV